MNPNLIDLLQRVQTGHATCMFAAKEIEANEEKLLGLIESAANRLETIQETDTTGLQLAADIKRLRAVFRSANNTMRHGPDAPENKSGEPPLSR